MLKKSRSWGSVFLLAAVSLVLLGCPLRWQRVSVNEVVKPEDTAFIVPGRTTLQEVIAHLGAPADLADTPEGALARYQFLDSKYFRINFGYALKFFTPPGVPDDLILAGGGIGTDQFLVWFDPAWVVRDRAFAHHTSASRYRLIPVDLP